MTFDALERIASSLSRGEKTRVTIEGTEGLDAMRKFTEVYGKAFDIDYHPPHGWADITKIADVSGTTSYTESKPTVVELEVEVNQKPFSRFSSWGP